MRKLVYYPIQSMVVSHFLLLTGWLLMALPASSHPSATNRYQVARNLPDLTAAAILDDVHITRSNPNGAAFPDYNGSDIYSNGYQNGYSNTVDMAAYELQQLFCGTVVYVTQNGAGNLDGSSWADALPGIDLQGALASACASTTFLIAQGVYKPTTGLNRTISFSIPSGVQVYGGYVGTGNTPDTRLSFPSSTTLSGNIGDPARTDNSYHVIRMTNASPQTRLDGVFIVDGNANGGAGNDIGGGLFNAGNGSANSSTPTLVQVSFVNNTASTAGGAIYNGGYNQGTSSPAITSARFESNTAESGGAIYNDALVSGTSSPILTNVVFTTNTAVNGGAIFNNARNGGNSSPVLTQVSFTHNNASTAGGALFNDGRSNGGSSRPLIINSSFRENLAPQGGAIATFSGSATITNGVFAGNGGGNTFYTNNGAHSFRYTLFDQAAFVSGPGNLSVNTSPFANPTGTELGTCSPAINAGDPGSVTTATGPYTITALPETDLAGSPRIVGNRVDMGAYEFQGTPFVAITAQPAATSVVCAGNAVTTSISTSGTVGSYQWYRNGQSLGAAQATATLSLPTTTTADMGSYSVVVTGSCNSVTSAAFSLSVNDVSAFTVTSASICSGESATLLASGCPAGGTLTWPDGSHSTVFVTTTAGTQAVTCTIGNCQISASGSVVVGQLPPAAVIQSLTVSGTLGSPTCSVALIGQATGTSFVFTNANGYVFSQLYRSGGSYSLSGQQITEPGVYTLTASYTNACGTSSPSTLTITVGGSKCP